MDIEDGIERARNQMTWLLKRVREAKSKTLDQSTDHNQGERVKEGRVLHSIFGRNVEVSFLDRGMRHFSTELSYCEELIPPTRKTKGRQPTFDPEASRLSGRKMRRAIRLINEQPFERSARFIFVYLAVSCGRRKSSGAQ